MGVDEHLTNIETEGFKKMIEAAVKAFPNFKVAATTLRNASSTARSRWRAGSGATPNCCTGRASSMR